MHYMSDFSKNICKNVNEIWFFPKPKEEIIELAQQGYSCQLIGENQWLLTK